MVELRQYRPCDLRHIKGREYERDLDGTRYARQFAKGPAWTIWDNNSRVVSAGVIIHWPGVGEVWMFLSDWIYSHPVEFCRISKRKLDEVISENNLWRVQAPICADMTANIAFAQAMGFNPEGTLRKFGPDGKDYIMYSLIKESV